MPGSAVHSDEKGVRGSQALCLFLLCLLAIPAFSCGKKGPPTLRSYEPPQSPVLHTLIHREDSILVLWDFPTEKEASIENFILLKSSGPGFERISTLNRSDRSFTDREFITGSSYSYKIISQNTKGVFSKDSAVMQITPLTPPQPPRNSSFRVEGNSIKLSWDEVKDCGAYNVYRRPAAGTYGLFPLNTSPLKDLSFSDMLNMQGPVYYTIRCLLNHGTSRDEGPPSGEIFFDPTLLMPPKPVGLDYFAVPGSVFLYWNELAERWVSGYRIYRRAGDAEYRLIGETDTPAYLDKDISYEKADYRVHALGLQNEGPGAEIRVTPRPPDMDK